MKVQVGQKVKYLRVDPQGKEVSGEGIVQNLFLSMDKRVQAGIKDGENRYNIDLPAIDPTPDSEKAYFAHVAAVRACAEVINAEIKVLAEKGNAEIEAMNVAFLGAPLDV